LLRLNLAYACERFQQLPFFESNLSLWCEMLQGAAATDAEMTAAGFGAQFRRLDNLNQLCLIKRARSIDDAQLDALTRQRIIDEDRLAIDVCDATAFVR
jgi:hypothetical protein